MTPTSSSSQTTADSGIPRLSVGLPVFNGARYLRQAFDSLLGQTFTDFELIVSDNASTDQTGAIAREYAARDPRVRYVRHAHNRGAAWNFNYVVELARGPYFKWAAADDVCADTFLAKCIEVLDREESVVCCHARSRRIDGAGNVLEHLGDATDGGLPASWFEHRRTRPDASSSTPHLRFRDVLLSTGWATRSYGVIRTEALRQTRLFQPYYGYEKVTMAEIALRGRFYDLPEILFFYRLHDAASSQLSTVSAQQQFFASQASQSRQFPRLQLFRGYLHAISAAPISRYQRICCHAWTVRYLLQMRKWPQVVRATCLGMGLGKGMPVAKQKKSTQPQGVHS